MRRYQLISVCKRLPGWILVVVPGVGWGAGDELLAWCRERFAAGMPRHPAADARGRCL